MEREIKVQQETIEAGQARKAEPRDSQRRVRRGPGGDRRARPRGSGKNDLERPRRKRQDKIVVDLVYRC